MARSASPTWPREAGQLCYPKTVRLVFRTFEAELRAVRGAEMAEPRACTLAQHIQMLTLQVAERDAVPAG